MTLPWCGAPPLLCPRSIGFCQLGSSECDTFSQVNVLSVVEALGRLDLKASVCQHLAELACGRRWLLQPCEESLVSAASAALCDRAQRLDQSYQEIRFPNERLSNTTALRMWWHVHAHVNHRSS